MKFKEKLSEYENLYEEYVSREEDISSLNDIEKIAEKGQLITLKCERVQAQVGYYELNIEISKRLFKELAELAKTIKIKYEQEKKNIKEKIEEIEESE